MIQSYRDLTVWRTAITLTERVYASTEKMPHAELFGLVTQMRRAAVSIPSNIAEGKAIGGKSYPRHIRIALGSESELETQIELTRRLKFLNEAEADELMAAATEVGRMLASLLRALPRD